MKRYSHTIVDTGIGTFEEMAEHPEGDWVKYEDTHAEISALRDSLRLCLELAVSALTHAHPRNSASISAIAKTAQQALKEVRS